MSIFFIFTGNPILFLGIRFSLGLPCVLFPTLGWTTALSVYITKSLGDSEGMWKVANPLNLGHSVTCRNAHILNPHDSLENSGSLCFSVIYLLETCLQRPYNAICLCPIVPTLFWGLSCTPWHPRISASLCFTTLRPLCSHSPSLISFQPAGLSSSLQANLSSSMF